MSSEDDAKKDPSETVLGQTNLLAQYFSLLFGISGWGETDGSARVLE